MNEEGVKIPVMNRFECPRCGHQAVAETGSVMICQPCVNEFLALNIGTMKEFVSGSPQVVPLSEPPV